MPLVSSGIGEYGGRSAQDKAIWRSRVLLRRPAAGGWVGFWGSETYEN
jgi:hypothetical protein